ncbi:Rrf2 family transcriptional regulator, partial [bacterium]
YLETVRGKGGGMRLGLAPEQIVLGRVIRHTEGDISLVECFGSDSDCRIQPACRLRAVLAEALAGMFLVLDGYTLADLLQQPQALEALIGCESQVAV